MIKNNNSLSGHKTIPYCQVINHTSLSDLKPYLIVWTFELRPVLECFETVFHDEFVVSQIICIDVLTRFVDL